MDCVPIADLVKDPARYIEPPCTLVAFGLSHLWTPNNRVKLGRVLHNPRPGVRRVVIDDRLFAAEPWRLWWPLKVVDAVGAWEYTDSYRAESRWRAALDDDAPDPFRWDVTRNALRGVVRGFDVPRFGAIIDDVRPVSPDVVEAYATEKESAFRDEKTLAAILKRLTKVAQEACPQRAVPTPSRFFEKRPQRIVRTDLAVDAWLAGQLLARADLADRIADFAEAAR